MPATVVSTRQLPDSILSISGTLTLDFGGGSSGTIITVAQTSFSSTTFRGISFIPKGTVQTSLNDFELNLVRFNIENIVDYTSFTIRGTLVGNARGIYTVDYVLLYQYSTPPVIDPIAIFNTQDDNLNQTTYLNYNPTFSGQTQYWLARNSRIGRTTSSTQAVNGDSILSVDLNVPTGEGGDQLIFSESGLQPDINRSTPSGLNGDNVVYYKYDGGFVHICNTLNAQMGMKSDYSPVKNAPYEYMHVIRFNKGLVPYESVVSGTFGLKYLGGNNWQLYSSYQGNDHFQNITWNITPLVDKIIILHFNMTSSTTLSFRISSQLNGNYYQGDPNWDVTFPTAKPLTKVVIGTSSHPLIADHFGGVIKSSGSFTTTERNTNISQMKSLFPIVRDSYTKAYLSPTISYSGNIFTLNPNFIANGSPYSFDISNFKIRWWQYFKNNGVGNAIDNRILMQSTDGNTYLFQDAGYTGNPLTYNRLAAGLITDGNKADIIVDIVDKNGYIYPFVSAPFGSYF